MGVFCGDTVRRGQEDQNRLHRGNEETRMKLMNEGKKRLQESFNLTFQCLNDSQKLCLGFCRLQLYQPATAVVRICLSGGCGSSPFIHTLYLLSYSSQSPRLQLFFYYVKYISMHRFLLPQLKAEGTQCARGSCHRAGGLPDERSAHISWKHTEAPVSIWLQFNCALSLNAEKVEMRQTA